MWNNHKKIILLAARAVIPRSVNPKTMRSLEAAIIDAFNLDPDEGVQEKDIAIIEKAFEPIVQKVIDIDYSAVKPDYLMKHGVNCEKVIHDGPGYDHAADYDDPYDVDMGVYCGRCHRGMDC